MDNTVLCAECANLLERQFRLRKKKYSLFKIEVNRLNICGIHTTFHDGNKNQHN